MLADAWAAPGLEIKAIAAYKGPSLPDDEDERMRTVCCAVQDDQDDPVLSSICKLVCSLLRVPSAGTSVRTPLAGKSCMCSLLRVPPAGVLVQAPC